MTPIGDVVVRNHARQAPSGFSNVSDRTVLIKLPSANLSLHWALAQAASETQKERFHGDRPEDGAGAISRCLDSGLCPCPSWRYAGGRNTRRTDRRRWIRLLRRARQRQKH